MNDSGHYIPLPINEDTLVNKYYTSKYPELLNKASTFSRMGGSKRRPTFRKKKKKLRKEKQLKKRKKQGKRKSVLPKEKDVKFKDINL